MMQAALDLAAAGFPVFPCSPRAEKGVGKRPLVPAETAPGARDGGLYLATLDEDQIRAWWGRWPNALIGMPTGPRSGLAVIDLDPRAFEADDMLGALEVWAGGEGFSGPAARTQSGGLHLWFAYPDLAPGEKVGNRAGLFAKIDSAPVAIREHVDVRGEGGYVILPPSVMDDGARYVWLRAPAEAAPPPLPGRLLDAILRRGEFAPGGAAPRPQPGGIAARAAGPVGRTGGEDEAVRRYARAVLDRARSDMAGTGQGQRGHTLNALAYMLGPYVELGALSEREAWAALSDGADACGLSATDGPQACDDKIRRGLEAGRRGSNLTSVSATLDRLRAEARERAARGAPAERPPPPRSEADYGLPEPPPRPQPAGEACGEPEPGDGEADDEQGPSADGTEVDDGVIAECASLDHSDTDNALRLIAHFGRELTVLAQDEATGGSWLGWTGTHWDLAGGAALSRLVAQRLGHRIGLEADHLAQTPQEEKAIADARSAEPLLAKLEAGKARKDWTDSERHSAVMWEEAIRAGKEARAALQKRRKARRSFGVSSKNKARIEAMLEMAAPRLRRAPDAFNANRLKVACTSHTLSFRRELDPECPDPTVDRWIGACHAQKGHRRDDWLTAIVPCDYDPDAPAPRWRQFLADMLPDPEKRRSVQAFAALGLLGVPVQYIMFHYGRGANGKSVFLETLTRVLGAGLAVGLPRESIVGGGERGAGAASPDLARLYGKRFVRVLEVPGDVPLQEDLIKRLTGGESFPVRTLFKGYFEFQSIATPHMSGNGYPTIDGTDLGIWRRLLVVHWDQTIPEAERRDFEEVVAEFVAEAPGILNWLIEGVKDYLGGGLFIAPSIRAATQEYREEMDPIGEYAGACLRPAPGFNVSALSAYESYVSWSMANAKKPKTQAKFGRVLGAVYRKTEIGGRIFYTDCELHSVPARPHEGPDGRFDAPPSWTDAPPAAGWEARNPP